VSGATLQSFFPLAGGLGEIQQAGFYADPICAPGHWCVRLYHRTATDALGMALPTFFSRCGRAGTGRCTGFWDAAQILTRLKMQVRKQVALLAFPLAGPDQQRELSPVIPSGEMEMLDGDEMNPLSEERR
jgi:hypothetical protein